MPRTLKVDLPGVPRIRALCSDSLGFIKVIETEGELGAPKLMARWGDPDPQQGVLCMSLSKDASPSLAVARKSGTVDVIDPVNGLLESRLVVPKSSVDVASNREASDTVCGLHLFSENSPCLKAVLTCTELGNAVLQGLPRLDEVQHPKSETFLSRWNVSHTGTVLCMAVDATEQYAVFGGKGVDVSVWNIKKGSRIWIAKAPHRDNLGLISPAWVTAISFLNEDHRKVVVGTGHHQVRLYDISSQRRPVLAFDYGEAPIRSITKDPDGFSVYVGTGAGDLACFDMRIGKLVGGFKGKCAGSIRALVRHPHLPLIASCGLDRYLRIHNTKTRQLLGTLFLKQQLVAVLFDVREDKSTVVLTSSQDGDTTLQTVTLETKTSNVNGDKASRKSKLKRQAEEGEKNSSDEKALKVIKSKSHAGGVEEELKNGTKKLKRSKSKNAQLDKTEEGVQEPQISTIEKREEKKPERHAEQSPKGHRKERTNEGQVKKNSKRMALESCIVNAEIVTEEGPITNGKKVMTCKPRRVSDDVEDSNALEHIRRVEVGKSSKKVRREDRNCNLNL